MRVESKNLLFWGVVFALILAPVALAEVIVYSESFEAGDGGYTSGGTLNQWQWGQPDATFVLGPVSANSGVNCWGTNLAGNVPFNSDSFLTSSAIAVPTLDANEVARVRFFAWIAVDTMNDRGEFQVSSDGLTWQTMAEFLYIMEGGWTEYYFDVSNYAGGNLYLRFRCRADGTNYFGSKPYNMAGLYVDDVAVIIAEAPAVKTTVTLEAWEDQSEYASCPWVYVWNGSEFVKDNDVYSTARGKDKEYADFYLLSQAPVVVEGKYQIQLSETEDEESFTDLVKLVTVDHAEGISVAPDNNGNILTYSAPAAPLSATDDQGNDVTAQLASADGIGVKGYDEIAVVLDFSNVDVTNGATLVLQAKGFIDDGSEPVPTMKPSPAIYIQTLGADNQWATQNIFWPRWNSALMAFDLKDKLSVSKSVRLLVASCHTNKYHVIDYAGLDNSAQQSIIVNTLSAESAIQSSNGDVTTALSASDDIYGYMARSESISMQFDAPENTGLIRDFVLISEGYYVPMGTYFIYTWDGSKWVQRDGWTVAGSGDQTRTFDLSLWLPDPDGEWKVRIWQDYWYELAGIDFVGVNRAGVPGVMSSAINLKNGQDITAIVSASDNNKVSWPADIVRNRWVEVKWEPYEINTPPTTNPVTIVDPNSFTPSISWTYSDNESDPQAMYEVEVWTSAGGTGINVWDPAAQTGTDTSILYAGIELVPLQTYYARVKAYDGNAWGAWSEISWTVPEKIEDITVSLDIKPVSTINPFNVTQKGVLPVTILGAADFDVTCIDLTSLKLAGVSPLRTSYEDVTSTLVPAGPDGCMDLCLKFDAQAIAAVLAGAANGDVVTLTIEGMTVDEIPITGQDTVLVIRNQ